MSNLTRFAILLALMASCAGFQNSGGVQANQQAPQTRTPKKAATAVVSGQITSHGKGKAGITVAVRTDQTGPQIPPIYKAVSDAEGNYRITNIPPGKYQIAPLAPAYVVADLNTFAFRGKSLILGEGESVDGIDFSIERGGVITGKVTHADGRPLIEERIQIVRADQVDQNIPIRFAEIVSQTDDRGIYRVYGLPPGRYKLSVGNAEDSFFSSVNRGRPAYPRVFYPATSDPNEAKVIEVTEGSEVSNIDITMRENVKGFSASGVVVDEGTNKPIANLQFALQRISTDRDTPMMGLPVRSDRLGIFRLENLSPGKYALFVVPQETELRSDAARFEIVDQDISGLVVKASKGASASGTVVLEGTQDKAVLTRLAQLRIVGYVTGVDPVAGGFVKTSPIGADGTFRVAGLQAGTLFLNLTESDRGMQTGFTITRIERDGIAAARGVEIKLGEQITNLRVVVAYGSGIVRGTVKIQNGPAPVGTRYMVRLFKPAERISVGRPQEVDARGHFVIEGIPAGVYELILNAYIPQSRARLPETKQTVTVADGEATEVDIVFDVDPKATPTP